MALVLGLGCDRDTPESSIITAIEQALQKIKGSLSDVRATATIDLKGDEEGLLACCAHQGWPLSLYRADELVKVEVPNPSEVVRRYVGTPAVSEAAALLLAGKTQESLLVEKHKYRGKDGRNVTVSIVDAD